MASSISISFAFSLAWARPVTSKSSSSTYTNHTTTPLNVINASMATANSSSSSSSSFVMDSHLHVWASPQEAAKKYPYSQGQEPTLSAHPLDLLTSMDHASVQAALIVQPITHKFDHSYLTSVLKAYPSKFFGCCLANPAPDGTGIQHLHHLVSKDGYCAVRFNPYLWPSNQKMTNDIGKALFAKAGELGVPVGFMCMKGINLHILEIEELCKLYPSTTVLIDHMGFCKPPISSDDDNLAFSNLLKLSRFPQVYVKFSALFRISREPFPYKDLTSCFSQLVSTFGPNRIMWGSDFPFVVTECGYSAAKEAVVMIAKDAGLSSSELEWIMGRTVTQLIQG